MKTMVDKIWTDAVYMDQVKADLKEFKERYTVGDLLRVFEDATGEWIKGDSRDVTKCEVKGFPAGTHFGNATHFDVDMTIDNELEVAKIRFYVDMDLAVSLIGMFGDKLYDVRRYVLAE